MKLFGLIGNPLSHSWSKKYFTDIFKRENIPGYRYELFQLSNIRELPKLIRENTALCGLNVTIPYKEDVIPYLDSLDEVAQKTGSVNCIKITRKGNKIKLLGFNTDAPAFQQTLQQLNLRPIIRALILGSGGASKSVAKVLEQSGIAFSVVSRSEKRGHLTYPDLSAEIVKDHLLIINTTPLGQFPEINQSPPIPYNFISHDHILYDLIYNPEITEYLKNGLEQHAFVKNGLELLHLQAEMSFNIWEQD